MPSKAPRAGAPQSADDAPAQRNSSLPPFLIISEAASVLRVSCRTVRRLINTGQLPCVRIGRSVRIRTSDLLALAMRERIITI